MNFKFLEVLIKAHYYTFKLQVKLDQTSDIDEITTYFCDNFGLSLFLKSTSYRKYHPI